MKLHLGCGQVYLDGYTNIDYPSSEHTVQEKPVADKFADLTKLKYKASTVDEVRLHHVYEHFTRPVALALLASWASWLKKGGTVHIEVPDFDATARLVLGRFSSDNDRKTALRHIFGSNEAVWATHYEGWSKKRLVEAMELMGFTVRKTIPGAYKATRNITVIATKSKSLSQAQARKKTTEYLSNFLIDKNDRGEKRLLAVWLKDFDKQTKQTWAK